MPSTAKSRRRRAILPFVLVGTSLVGLTAVTTGAVFTGSSQLEGTFVTGSVDISTSPVTNSAFTLPNMAPGDSVVGAITVTNTGTLAERYSVTTTDAGTDTANLAHQLQLTVMGGLTAATCNATDFGSGSQIYNGPLADVAAATNIIGNPEQGQQTGDRIQAANSAADVLCMRVTLPSDTGNAFQGKTAKVTMTFNAEQTVNN